MISLASSVLAAPHGGCSKGGTNGRDETDPGERELGWLLLGPMGSHDPPLADQPAAGQVILRLLAILYSLCTASARPRCWRGRSDEEARALSTDATATLVNLSGQVALVTGGGRGFGRAFAIALANAGAHVAVAARTAGPLAEMVERAGGRALAVPGEVVTPEAVAHVVRITESATRAGRHSSERHEWSYAAPHA